MDYKLKKLLQDEAGGVELPDEIFERFVGKMTEIHLKDKEVLIPYDIVDTSLHILKEGILRTCYRHGLHGENEKTYGFSEPGTVLISYYSVFMHKPAIFKRESCGESVVLKMSREDLDELLNGSFEFARWFIAIQSAQLSIIEFRHAFINGRPEDRYMWTLKNRPEVLARVPLKIFASYLGVTPVHLSRLRKSFFKSDK